ncbi:MAG: hypothetical protein RR406_00095 [Bacilli bacterium]
MAQRIFTIVGRGGTAIVTDSKLNANGSGSYETFKGEDTQLEALKALNKTLARIPRNTRFETPVTFLLCNTVSFLAYEDTRSYWIEKGHTKGEDKKEINPAVLVQVKELHKQLNELNTNVRLFGQKGIKSPVFNSYINASWNLMNQIVEKPKTISAVDAF